MHTFAQVKSHPFFEDVNWDDVALKKVHHFFDLDLETSFKKLCHFEGVAIIW